jgi:hypothetical protein
VEEIPMGEDGLVGMLFLNEHPIIILFHSWASHDFISSACAKRGTLILVALGVPYVISTPGGRVDTDSIAEKVPLELSERVISTNHIVLGGHGIGVILGMRWMKLHKVILDISDRLVHLYSPMHGKVILHLPVIVCNMASFHHVVELKIKDILIVWEFQDLFPNELLGMPPERAIEFKIEL